MKKPFYVRVAILALLSVPVLLGVLGVGLLTVGGRPPIGVIPPLAFEAIVCTVLAGLLWWSHRFFLLPTFGVTLFATLIGFLLGSEYGLAHPESFFDFTTSIVTVAGPFVACVASVAALRRRGKSAEDRPVGPVARRVVQGVPASIVIVALISAFLTVVQRPVVVTPANAVTVVASADSFEPNEFRVAVGDKVEFLVQNEDSYAHTFTIDELEIDEYIAPRGERLVRLVASRTSRPVELYCAIIGHEEMTGRIVIDPLPSPSP